MHAANLYPPISSFYAPSCQQQQVTVTFGTPTTVRGSLGNDESMAWGSGKSLEVPGARVPNQPTEEPPISVGHAKYPQQQGDLSLAVHTKTHTESSYEHGPLSMEYEVCTRICTCCWDAEVGEQVHRPRQPPVGDGKCSFLLASDYPRNRIQGYV